MRREGLTLRQRQKGVGKKKCSTYVGDIGVKKKLMSLGNKWMTFGYVPDRNYINIGPETFVLMAQWKWL